MRSKNPKPNIDHELVDLLLRVINAQARAIESFAAMAGVAPAAPHEVGATLAGTSAPSAGQR